MVVPDWSVHTTSTSAADFSPVFSTARLPPLRVTLPEAFIPIVAFPPVAVKLPAAVVRQIPSGSVPSSTTVRPVPVARIVVIELPSAAEAVRASDTVAYFPSSLPLASFPMACAVAGAISPERMELRSTLSPMVGVPLITIVRFTSLASNPAPLIFLLMASAWACVRSA